MFPIFSGEGNKAEQGDDAAYVDVAAGGHDPGILIVHIVFIT